MVDAQAVEHGGVEVVDVDGVFKDVVGEVVGFADGLTGFDAAAGAPKGVASWVMVATEAGFGDVALAVGGASEFAAPDDQGIFEEAALF